MLYTVDPDSDEPIMLIMDRIGFDEMGNGISGVLFQQELLALDRMEKKRIQIWINSPGGTVTEGFTIFSGILKTKTPVDTYCVGMAASMGAVIFQAGRKRIMYDFGILMFHAPYNPNGESDQSALDQIKAMTISCNKMIAGRSGMTPEQVDKLLSKDTFINADEAYSLGLCDQVELTAEANVKYLRKEKNAENYAKECAKIVNSLLQTDIKNTSMIKVTARLNLNDAAKEEDVVAEINKIENRAKIAEGKVETLTTEATATAQAHTTALTEVQNKLTAESTEKEVLKTKLQQVQDKLTAMETDKKNAEKATAKLAIENTVKEFAKVGRIKNEASVILEWTELGETIGLEKVKSMIEALPLNKTAPAITNIEPNKLEAGVLPTTSMGLAVKNKLKREGKAA